MIRTLLTASLAFLLLLPLAGCWDRRELNELAISLALGIDKVGQHYRVTLQVVQPGQVTSKSSNTVNSAPVTLYQTNGVTIYEAIRKMTTVSPRKIYAAHLRVAVFGEDLAREGIGDALDLLSRDYELRTDFYLLIAKGTTAASALNLLFPLEKIPANKIYGSIQTAEKVWAPVTGVTLDEFISDASGYGKNPVLSGINVTGNKKIGGSTANLTTVHPSAELHNVGLAVFREDRLVGWLNEIESKGYAYITNHVKSTVGHIPCPQGGYIAIEVVRSTAKIKGTVRNGRPRLGVDLRVENNVGEVQCRIDLTKLQTVQDLQHSAERRIEGIVRKSITAAQTKYKSDIFGFGSAVHRGSPGAWNTMRTDWDAVFADADVDVSVKVKLKRTGTMTNAYKEKKE